MRLISTTSASPRRATVLSRYIAAWRPAKPPPAITILIFISIVTALSGYNPLQSDSSSWRQMLLNSYSGSLLLTAMD